MLLVRIPKVPKAEASKAYFVSATDLSRWHPLPGPSFDTVAPPQCPSWQLGACRAVGQVVREFRLRAFESSSVRLPRVEV